MFKDNTIESIQGAINRGYDGVEIDVQVCLTGELVLFHDLYDGDEFISSLTIDEIRTREIVTLHVSETPCGHCRQFMRELSNSSALKIHCKGQTFQIEDLLPGAFGENRKKGHGLLDSTATYFDHDKTKPTTQAQLAINAAQRSYAPYSQSPEGFVAQCLDGHFFSGRAAESIAFNPSVSGVVVALNQRNLSSRRSVAITACTQAKLATALNSPLAQAKDIIRHITEAPVDEVHMEVQPS